MRLREILTALIAEAKNGHWDTAHAIWMHPRTGCAACDAAMAAQLMLSTTFVDLQPGDEVSIGDDSGPFATFGIVERVITTVEVVLGYATWHGIQPVPSCVAGMFDAARLTRLEDKTT